MVALVAQTEPDQPGKVAYVGVGRVVARGGLAGALERRIRSIQEDVDIDDGKFCDMMCIIDDQCVGSRALLIPVFGGWDRNQHFKLSRHRDPESH